MLCFKDQSFCLQYSLGKCVNHDCERALTEELKEEGRKWWGKENFPVSFIAIDPTTCENFLPKELTGDIESDS